MPEKEINSENVLEVILPDKTRRTVGIVDSPFLMGRGDETGNHLQLDDPRISRRCAAILTEGKRCLLEDLGHRRGIFVNGNKIDHFVLSDGDVITFGYDDSYEVVFRAIGAEKAMQSMLTLIGGVSAKDNPATGLGKLNLLLEATSLLHSDLPLDSVIGTMLDFAVSITHADRGLLLEADEAGALQVRLARGSGGVALPSAGLNPSQTALKKAMAQQAAVITEDLNLADTAFRGAQSIVSQSLRAVIAIPLYAVSRAASAVVAAPAGAPGVARAAQRGQFLGMLYLDSRKASAFSKLDRQILDALAMEAASILDNARLVERERQRQRLEQELNIARDIQQALLPRGFHDLPYLRIAGIHTPCHAVGGDYFDVFPLSEDRTAILVADVSGKGLGAALLTTMLQGALSGMSNTTDPVQVLNHLNRFLCSHSAVGRYATMFLSILDRNGQLLFINAGHPSPLIIRQGEVMDLLTDGSFPVGLVPEAEFFAITTNLQPGDTLALFSDGVTEAMDPQEELYGVPRLREVLVGRHDQPLDHIQKTVLDSIQKFTRGASQNDDITLLLVRYQAPDAAAVS